MALEQPCSLRKLAAWYRGMADVGHTDERAWRIGFAEYLEKRANEIEHVEKCDEAREVIA